MISDSAHSARQSVFMNHRNKTLKAMQIKHGEITSHNHQTRFTLRGSAKLHRVRWFSVGVSRAAHWLPAQTENTLRPGGGGGADSQGDGVNTGSKVASRMVQGLHATISEKIFCSWSECWTSTAVGRRIHGVQATGWVRCIFILQVARQRQKSSSLFTKRLNLYWGAIIWTNEFW